MSGRSRSKAPDAVSIERRTADDVKTAHIKSLSATIRTGAPASLCSSHDAAPKGVIARHRAREKEHARRTVGWCRSTSGGVRASATVERKVRAATRATHSSPRSIRCRSCDSCNPWALVVDLFRVRRPRSRLRRPSRRCRSCRSAGRHWPLRWGRS